VIQLLNNVLPIVQATTPARQQSAYLLEVVRALSNVSAFDPAMDIIGKISNRLHRALACCTLAESFARDGIEQASNVMLGHAWQASDGDFSGWQWEGQQFHTYSKDLVKQMSDVSQNESERLEGLAQVAISFASLAHMEEAASLAERAEALAMTSLTVNGICKCAEALWRINSAEKADRMMVRAYERLRRLEDVMPRVLGLTAIAQTELLRGRAADARAAVVNATDLLAASPHYTRGEACEFVRRVLPVLAELDGQALYPLYQSMAEVEGWWP